MTKDFRAGPGYSQSDWDAVDSPELTEDELATARPFGEALPGLAAAIRKSGRPKSASTKVPVKLRLDPVALDAWKASGPGWQTRLNDLFVREAPKAGKTG